MKNITLALSLLIAGNLIAADSNLTSKVVQLSKKDSHQYNANELSIDIYGTTRTSNIKDYSSGAGIGINYFYTKNVGAGIELSSDNTKHSLVDNANLNLIARLPLKKLSNISPYFGVGGGYGFEKDIWHVQAFTGVEYRMNKRISFFSDIRGVRDISALRANSEYVMGRVGIRLVAF